MKNNKLQVIATVNTQKLSEEFLKNLINNGVTIVRLNGAHIQPEDISGNVNLIRKVCSDSVDILIDLPGNKIRTKNIYQAINLRNGDSFILKASNFTYPDFIKFIQKEDEILSSDGQLKMKVMQVNENEVTFIALCDGQLLNNKGIHLTSRSLAHLPFLFKRDFHLLEECKKNNVNFVGFSFVRSIENVNTAFELLADTDITPIIKLETREATDDVMLNKIIELADHFLIDRGDLLSEVGVPLFPSVFNNVMNKVINADKKLFVASQLFASMCEHNLPYISEIIEFSRIVNSGVCGIQLSDEIAVGKCPIEVLKLIKSIMEDKN